jgi:hypothetical protein
MLGHSFEQAMKKLFQNREYKILKSVEDSLGFYPEELLEIAKNKAHKSYLTTNKHFGDKEKHLSAKAVLDHYFKIDDLLELPRSSKSETVRIVGIQWYSYSENFGKLEVQEKIDHKLRQLLATQEACKEIYLQNTFVVAGYVPSWWEGIGLMTQNQTETVNRLIDNLVLDMCKYQDKPKLLEISFDF